MTRSQPNPSLAPFDPEIERTLFHIRQARKRLRFGKGEEVFTTSTTLLEVNIEPSLKEGINHTPINLTNNSSFVLGTNTMDAPRRVTIKEAGAPDYVLQPLHVTHPT